MPHEESIKRITGRLAHIEQLNDAQRETLARLLVLAANYSGGDEKASAALAPCSGRVLGLAARRLGIADWTPLFDGAMGALSLLQAGERSAEEHSRKLLLELDRAAARGEERRNSKCRF